MDLREILTNSRLNPMTLLPVDRDLPYPIRITTASYGLNKWTIVGILIIVRN